jgi:hypothetical protein
VSIGAYRAIRIRIQLSSLASLTLKDRLALAGIERSASEYISVRIEQSKILPQLATLVPSKLSGFKLTEFSLSPAITTIIQRNLASFLNFYSDCNF